MNSHEYYNIDPLFPATPPPPYPRTSDFFRAKNDSQATDVAKKNKLNENLYN